MEDKTLKRSWTAMEEEQDTDSQAAKRTFLHPEPSSEPLHLHTGSSYSQYLQPGTFLEPLDLGTWPSHHQFFQPGISSQLDPGSWYPQFLHPRPSLEPLYPCIRPSSLQPLYPCIRPSSEPLYLCNASSYSPFLQPGPLSEPPHPDAKSSYSQFLQPRPLSGSLHLGNRPFSEPLHLYTGSSSSHFLQPGPFLKSLYQSTRPVSEPLDVGIGSSYSQCLQPGPSSEPLYLSSGSSYSQILQPESFLQPLYLGARPSSESLHLSTGSSSSQFLQPESSLQPLHLGTGSSSLWFQEHVHFSEPLHMGTRPLDLGMASSYSWFLQPGPSSEPLGIGISSSSNEGSVNKKFDVFISHRGPDTKQTLAYHLYDVLCLRGVNVFLDQAELQSGETLTEAIKEALACSGVHVCILSSGFTESPWCLRELVMMLHKHNSGASTLIPIFYDVEPSDVRHVKGDFGQRFQKLKSEGNHSSEEIDQWKEALHKIVDVTGYEGKGELCMTIVNRICMLLDVESMVTSGKVVGIEKQLLSTINDIVRCRQNGFGVTLLEISGIPGIGKTTFAKELYNKIYAQYRRRCCFIEDVKGLVEKGGINEVYKQLLSQLFKDEGSYSLKIMKKHLWKRLQNAEILLVLDNIDKELPFRTVFIENVSLNPNSIIIVTCRERGVLKHDPAAIDLYGENVIQREISCLDFNTSKELFCRYAFAGIDNARHEYGELINKMVEKCKGIPLVLTLLGARLHGKDIGDWNYLWISIKDSLLSHVKEILKFIYDNLNTELEKCLFLDVATFFRWEKEELLVKLRQSDDEHGEQEVQYALDALKKNLLIHVSNDGVLGMHDVFVDLGKSIVEDEDKCPGRRSRVWRPSDVKNILSLEKGTKKVKALSLVSQGSQVVLDNNEYPWHVDAFSKMSSLEILILHGHCIEGDLSKLSRRLLWLKWMDFPLHEIPRTLCLKHVRVLHVCGESLIHLWEHSEREAPSNLRELIVQDCIQLQRLPESMGKLRHLTCINLHKCTSLKIIPDSFGQLQGLKHLEFHGCHALECLPDTFGGLTRLHNLKMRGCCSMVSLPESVGDLRSLTDLSIEKCHAMVSLPESSAKLVQLQHLWIRDCDALERLPQSLRCWTNLVRVNVFRCGKIRLTSQQFQGIHSPSSELHLSVYDDDVMEVAHSLLASTVLRNFVQPIQIKQHTSTAGLLVAAGLHLAGNINDRRAPQLSGFELIANHIINSASGLLDERRSLHLEGCWNVKELALCNLRHLVTLNLSYCYNLPKLSDSIGSLSFLEDLSLIWCMNLEEVDLIGNLQNLRWLRIVLCLALKGLPSCTGNLSRLEELIVIDCWMMEVIHTQALFSLNYLEVSGCVKLSRIVGLSQLSSRTVVRIQGCLNLREMMVGTRRFNQLHDVDITRCDPLGDWQLSLNPDIFKEDTKTFEEVLEGSLNATSEGSGILNVKTNPMLALVVEQKIKDLIGCQNMCCFFHKLPLYVHRRHVLSLPFIPHMVVLCLISSVVYTIETARQVPPPKTNFFFSTDYKHYYQENRHHPCHKRYYHYKLYTGPGVEYNFRRFDCGEEIHFAVLPFGVEGDIKSCDDDICVNISKGKLMHDDDYDYRYKNMNSDHARGYEALIKDGWMVYLGDGKEYLAKEIRNICYSEFRKQCSMSSQWTQLPSQLHIYEFSALDIAGCQVNKISRHGSTCIMEEESGLIWSRRRCLFMDDHALLLHHPKGSEHSFLAYPAIDRDLERILAYQYEMSISILVKGKVVSSRKLQQIIPITEEEIPPHLNTLLQGRDFHSSSETMLKWKLFMLEKLKKKSFYYKKEAKS